MRRAVLGLVGAGVLAVTLAVPSVAFAGTYRSIYSASYFAGPPRLKQAKSATARFSVPSIACKSTELSGISPAVSVWDGAHRTSKIAATVAVELRCSHGKVTYTPYFSINGAWTTVKLTLAKGDVVSMTATQLATGTTLGITDITTHKAASRKGAGAHASTYGTIMMNWVQRSTAKPVPLPVPNFGKLTFTNAAVNGARLGDLSLSKYLMYGGGKEPPAASAHLLIDVGPIVNKTSFTCTFKRAS